MDKDVTLIVPDATSRQVETCSQVTKEQGAMRKYKDDMGCSLNHGAFLGTLSIWESVLY